MMMRKFQEILWKESKVWQVEEGKVEGKRKKILGVNSFM